MDLANPGIMAQFASLPTVNQGVQSTLLGQQNIEQNQNVLAQQQRAEQARQAMAVATDPNAAPDLRNQAMNALQQADAPAAAALRQQMQQKQALASYFQNPTAKGTMELVTNFPALKDEISKGWDVYQGAAKEAKLAATADAYGYLQAGDAPGAIKIIRDHMEADRAAGLDINGYQELADAIQSNPKTGLAIAGLMLAAGAGPEKFAEAHGKIGDTARADELQPAMVRKAGAEATTAEVGAQFAPAVAQSGLETAAAQRQRMAAQTANDMANTNIAQGRLALDTNKLAADTNVAMAKIEQEGGKLTPGSEKIVNEAAAESAATQQIADKEKALAGRIRSAGLHSGMLISANEALKSVWGGQDQYTQLRAEYNQIKNSAALANRKQMPGAMSDADREFLLQGFPKPNADPAYIARFLDTMAKGHDFLARQSDNEASWAAANGSLGPAKQPMVIDGMRVPAGMTFRQHQGLRTKIDAPALPDDAAAVMARARGGH